MIQLAAFRRSLSYPFLCSCFFAPLHLCTLDIDDASELTRAWMAAGWDTGTMSFFFLSSSRSQLLIFTVSFYQSDTTSSALDTPSHCLYQFAYIAHSLDPG